MFSAKKAAPSSEWEIYQCFDKRKGEYIPLDCDAWAVAHKVPEEGKKRGKHNQPGSDETLNDTMFLKIEAWVRNCALACKGEVTNYLIEEVNYLNELKSSWEKENPEINVDSLVKRRCNDLQATADQSVSDINKQRAEYEDAARDLRAFRQDHGLSRVAHYPISQAAHWLWIPVAAIIETFVGANLLGSVSRGGVIEGWMVALVLTLVNILLGVGAGQIWRLTHYQWGFKKIFAYCLSVFFVAIALIWNNVAGHVRDVYVRAEKSGQLEALDEAFATAYRTMVENPLPWESLQSAGLALVGIAVFFLTMYKMYTADDPFPGYGSKHRKAEELLQRYQDYLNDARENFESVRNQVNVEIDEFKDRFEMDQSSWINSLHKVHITTKDYPVNLSQFNRYLAYLIAAYRDANLAARTTPPPPFFSRVPTINEDEFQLSELDIPDPPQWGDIPSKVKKGFKQVEETYEQNLKRFQMLDRVVEDYEDKSDETRRST